jgi:hypothetical protein
MRLDDSTAPEWQTSRIWLVRPAHTTATKDFGPYLLLGPTHTVAV